jgi:hypothetical protein
VRPTALLAAYLHHLLGFPHGRHHLKRWLDGVRDGLLAVHILAGVERRQHDGAVQVIRSGDQDPFDVFVLKQAPVVSVGAHLAAGFRHELLKSPLLDVTSGDKRDVIVPYEGSVYLIAPGAEANDAHLHPVVGATDLVGDQGRGSRNFQKLASVFHPNCSPINEWKAQLREPCFFLASARIPRIYSAASWAFLSTKSSPTNLPSTTGSGWHNSKPA